MNRFHRWFCGSERWATAVQARVLPWVIAGEDLGSDVLEIGPGPGRVTESIRYLTTRLTSLEIDQQLARALEDRFRGTNVEVVHGDAARMPFPDGRFSSALCLTMLHHVRSPELQDRLLAETFRVLRPGGLFVGCDSRWSLPLQLMHWFDTMVLVPPDSFVERLERVGFDEVRVDEVPQAFRFRARRPIITVDNLLGRSQQRATV